MSPVRARHSAVANRRLRNRRDANDGISDCTVQIEIQIQIRQLVDILLANI